MSTATNISSHLHTAERRARIDCRSLIDAELVSVLTALPLREAKKLMADAQSLRGLTHATMPLVSELRLSAAFELSRRLQHQTDARPELSTPSAIMQRKLAHLGHEEFWVLAVNSRNVLLKAYRAGTGSIHLRRRRQWRSN
jgi:DNA repair protein RadC